MTMDELKEFIQLKAELFQDGPIVEYDTSDPKQVRYNELAIKYSKSPFLRARIQVMRGNQQ